MRTIPTGRGGATGPPGAAGANGAAGPAAILSSTQNTYSQGAVAPVAFATLVYKDTVTGFVYVWNQATQLYVRIV